MLKMALAGALLGALLLVLPITHASLQDWSIDILLNEDKTSDWTVSYAYTEPVDKSDFFLLVGVTNYNVTADGKTVDCDITRGIGSSIVCHDLNARSVVYRIRTFPITSSLQGLRIFSSRLSVTEASTRFSVKIRLPLGMALTEAEKLAGTGLNPFEPAGAQQDSDGRYIFVVWNFNRPTLGDTYDFTVVYEPLQPQEESFNLFLVVIAAVIIAFLAVLVLFFSRRRVEELLPILTDNERKVMEIVLREKKVDQRQIIKETDFSKPKVSRLIQDLERRGLIEKQPKGRTNIITMKKTKDIGNLPSNLGPSDEKGKN